MLADNCAGAIELAAWKKKIHANWHNIKFERVDDSRFHINTDESLHIKISAYLNGISPEDVQVECVVGLTKNGKGFLTVKEKRHFKYQGKEGNNHIFILNLCPSSPGLNHYKIRMYPYHKLLSHPLETGYLLWI